MTWKRGFAVSILVLVIGSARVGVLAQDTPPEPPPTTPESEAPPTPEPEAPAIPPATPPATPDAQPTTATTPSSDETTKVPFWGDHFALYIEGGGGMGSVDSLESSIETSAKRQAFSRVDINNLLSARVVVGWKLPLDRGSFRVAFTGHSEDSYEFEAKGLTRALFNSAVQPAAPQLWWNVSIHDGTLTSVQTPPTWVDTDSDGIPDQDEIHFVPGTGPPAAVRSVPNNLQNRIQTWDFLFARDFGGRTWSGDYTCGIRHLIYKGNIAAAAWLNESDASSPAGGFTDGTNLRLLSLNQDTTGTGPTGSLGLQWHLFKNRLTFFADARFAFLLQDMHTNSGDFFTLVTNANAVPPFTQTVPAHIEQSVSKSTWNFGGSFGARVRVVEGFHVDLTFERIAYQDAVLLPFAITIPTSAEQAPFRTVALYHTQDLKVDSLRVTLGFQF